MSLNKKTFCPLPWSHLYLEADGNMMACCTSKTILGHVSEGVEKIWNNEKLREIRRDLLSGVEPSNCSNCFTEEKHGKTSYRQVSLQKHENIHFEVSRTDAKGYLESFNLQSADFRFSNLCNFKCRPCNSRFSSSIALEEKNIAKSEASAFVKPGDSKDFSYEALKQHYDTLQRIYFAGGEPLLQWEHWAVLEDLTRSGKSKNIELTYSTNASKLTQDNKNIFNYWKQFKSVAVCLSIDAVFEKAQYWRHGTNWTEVEKNILLLRDFTLQNQNSICYSINSAVGWPNIIAWTEMVRYFVEKKIIYSPDQIAPTAISGPPELSLKALPRAKKEIVAAQLNEFKDFLNAYFGKSCESKVDFFIQYMMSEDTQSCLPEFKRQLLLDKARNEDFFKVFPEHQDLKPLFGVQVNE
jgi:pyruvate-formate lyase-activating enzyme